MPDDTTESSAPTPGPARRALGLTNAIYSAAVTPTLWPKFLDELSNELGGATIAMSLQFPGVAAQPEYYRTQLDAKYLPVFEKHYRRGLPWPIADPLFREGFRRASELFPDDRVADTAFYRDYMQPQGIAPEGPIAHLIVADGGLPISGISIHRLHEHRHFDNEDLAMCNLLAPHLARAHAVRRQLRASQQEQRVRTKVLDRLPTGFVLVDATRRVVAANRAGERILARRDGIQLDDGLLHATGHSNQVALHALFDGSVADSPEPASRFLAIQRPSGKRPYSVIISPLLDAPADSQVGGRVSAVFITDPEPNAVRLTASIHAFGQMYSLTPAESKLIALLAEGRSLQEISDDRGVTINTTRTQLRHLFRKTQTNRQSELVQLALTGIAGVSQD